MVIAKYILIAYLIITEVIGLIGVIALFQSRKEGNVTLFLYLIAICMPITIPLIFITLLLEYLGIPVLGKVDFSHNKRVSTEEPKSLNDYTISPEVYSVGLKDLPFEPEPSQIIYVENEYNEELNDFIKNNFYE